MFSQTPAHGDSKNEMRQRKGGSRKTRRTNMGSREGTKKKSPDGLTVARAYRPPGSLSHELVDELPNAT